ncbi:hypothetical protein B0H11DRAFT_1928721 [Mycena galericulata]|nr:hypothetical protein B0H11DRAFT_1928721 [Mycena galericulata]
MCFGAVVHHDAQYLPKLFYSWQPQESTTRILEHLSSHSATAANTCERIVALLGISASERTAETIVDAQVLDHIAGLLDSPRSIVQALACPKSPGMCDLRPVLASSLKRRRLDAPEDELDKCAVSQGLGEVEDTHGQNNIYSLRPNVSGSVRVRTQRRRTADNKDAAIKLRLVEAELNSVRAQLETANAEIAAMRFVVRTLAALRTLLILSSPVRISKGL